MKINKKHLKKIIREEYIKNHRQKTKHLSKLVREAYAETVLFKYPAHCLKEGIINKKQYRAIRRYSLIAESTNPISKTLNEDIGDTIAKVAEKIGTQVGTAGAGIAGGLWRAMYSIAKKIGSSADEAAKDSLNYVINNTDNAIAGAGKLAANAVTGGREAAAALAKAAEQGLDYKQMAQKDPESFLKVYNALKQKLSDMNAPVQSAAIARAALGVFETPEGEDALLHGAEEAGVSAEELKSLMALYVLQSGYVELATRTLEAQGEKEAGHRKDSYEEPEESGPQLVAASRNRLLRIVKKHTR